MTAAPRAATVLLVACALGLAGGGCAGKRAPGTPPDPDADVAVYRGRVTDREGNRDRFRVTLFARLPDRVHAEVSGPVGGPRLIVDGGDGRVAISVIGERTAYVGPAEPDALAVVFGIAMPLETLVRALLVGDPPAGANRFVRRPAGRAGWPDHLAVDLPGGTLVLDLLRTRPLPAGDGARLGRGTPAPGMRVEPLERWTRPTERR